MDGLNVSRRAKQARLDLVGQRKRRRHRRMMFGLGGRQECERRLQWAGYPAPLQIFFSDRPFDRPALRPEPRGFLMLPELVIVLVGRPRKRRLDRPLLLITRFDQSPPTQFGKNVFGGAIAAPALQKQCIVAIARDKRATAMQRTAAPPGTTFTAPCPAPRQFRERRGSCLGPSRLECMRKLEFDERSFDAADHRSIAPLS